MLPQQKESCDTKLTRLILMHGQLVFSIVFFKSRLWICPRCAVRQKWLDSYLCRLLNSKHQVCLISRSHTGQNGVTFVAISTSYSSSCSTCDVQDSSVVSCSPVRAFCLAVFLSTLLSRAALTLARLASISSLSVFSRCFSALALWI